MIGHQLLCFVKRRARPFIPLRPLCTAGLLIPGQLFFRLSLIGPGQGKLPVSIVFVLFFHILQARKSFFPPEKALLNAFLHPVVAVVERAQVFVHILHLVRILRMREQKIDSFLIAPGADIGNTYPVRILLCKSSRRERFPALFYICRVELF